MQKSQLWLQRGLAIMAIQSPHQSTATLIRAHGSSIWGLVRIRGLSNGLMERAHTTKEYAQVGIINQLEPIDVSSYSSQQTETPSYDSGYGQQAQPVQPVVAEPVALQQWTDDNGHTFRRMDDGSTLWWNGSDWQKYA